MRHLGPAIRIIMDLVYNAPLRLAGFKRVVITVCGVFRLGRAC